MSEIETLFPATEARLCLWLGRACPGDRLTYHRGSRHYRRHEVGREVWRLLRRVRWAEAQGLVRLDLRPLGEGIYLHCLVVLPRDPLDPAPGFKLLQRIERAAAPQHDGFVGGLAGAHHG